MAELKATGGKVFKFTALLKRYFPKIEDRLGKEPRTEARVRVVEVRRGHLIGAFVQFTSKDYKPCSEDEDQFAYVWLLTIRFDHSGTPHLALLNTKTRLFDDKKAKVAFPKIAKHVAIFQVTHSAKGEEEQCEEEQMVTKTQDHVELYFADRRGITLLTSMEVSSSAHEPGNEKFSETRVRWIRGAGHHLAYLMLVSGEVDTNIETSGEAEGFNSTCVRSSSISALTKQGKLIDLTGKNLAAAEKRVPALTKVPPDLEFRTFSDKDTTRPDASDCIESKRKPAPRRRAR